METLNNSSTFGMFIYMQVNAVQNTRTRLNDITFEMYLHTGAWSGVRDWMRL